MTKKDQDIFCRPKRSYISSFNYLYQDTCIPKIGLLSEIYIIFKYTFEILHNHMCYIIGPKFSSSFVL